MSEGQAPDTANPLPSPGPGRYGVPVWAAGYWWWYHVHVPETYESRSALPLVFILHGTGGSAGQYLDLAGWARKSEEAAFIAVAPEGLPAKPHLEPNVVLNPRQWNAGQYDSSRPRSKVDDLDFFETLLADVQRRWRIDGRRIYVAGHSSGGSMAFRLAAHRSEQIAAIASVAGHCWVPDPQLVRPVPTLLLVGTKDPIIPLDGGVAVLPWEVRESPPLEQTMSRWCLALGCSRTVRSTQKRDGLIIEDYAAANGQTLFQCVLIEGHGHDWPGPVKVHRWGNVFLGPQVSTIDATELIWAFLREHSLKDCPPSRP